MSSGREEIVISSLHAGNRMQPSRSSSLQVTSALHLISRSIFFLPTCLSASRPELRFILTLWQKGRKDWLQKKNDQIQRESAFLQITMQQLMGISCLVVFDSYMGQTEALGQEIRDKKHSCTYILDTYVLTLLVKPPLSTYPLYFIRSMNLNLSLRNFHKVGNVQCATRMCSIYVHIEKRSKEDELQPFVLHSSNSFMYMDTSSSNFV